MQQFKLAGMLGQQISVMRFSFAEPALTMQVHCSLDRRHHQGRFPRAFCAVLRGHAAPDHLATGALYTRPAGRLRYLRVGLAVTVLVSDTDHLQWHAGSTLKLCGPLP